jgi:hypothetical protein
VKLGWIVLAHDQPAQVARLLSRLAAGGDTVFLHIDARSDAGPFVAATRDIPGVRLLPRFESRWGGYGLVAAALAGIEAALTVEADYLLLVSGQDYPVKPVDDFRSFLAANVGTVFMKSYEIPNPQWHVAGGGLSRFDRRHYRLLGRTVTLPNRWTPFVPARELPFGLTPFSGSQW